MPEPKTAKPSKVEREIARVEAAGRTTGREKRPQNAETDVDRALEHERLEHERLARRRPHV